MGRRDRMVGRDANPARRSAGSASAWRARKAPALPSRRLPCASSGIQPTRVIHIDPSRTASSRRREGRRLAPRRRRGMSVLPGAPGWLTRFASRRLACPGPGTQPATGIHIDPSTARAESSASAPTCQRQRPIRARRWKSRRRCRWPVPARRTSFRADRAGRAGRGRAMRGGAGRSRCREWSAPGLKAASSRCST